MVVLSKLVAQAEITLKKVNLKIPVGTLLMLPEFQEVENQL